MLSKPTRVQSGFNQVAELEFATHSETLRGHLTVLQYKQNIPFPIARLFYIHGTPTGCARGAHAHYDTEQLLIAIAGTFLLEVTDGHESKTFTMCNAAKGVYIPAMTWVAMHDFSPGTVCLVLASTVYDPKDYIRDWEIYVAATREQSA
ncbi:MAG: FdtA/QdtA family cupin domain-containing protein [Candidatus Acidiferrum sp.]